MVGGYPPDIQAKRDFVSPQACPHKVLPGLPFGRVLPGTQGTAGSLVAALPFAAVTILLARLEP